MAGQDGWAALFQDAFMGSRNAMVLLDDQRRHVDVNGAYVKLSGYPRGELLGRPVWDFVEGGPRLTQREWLATIALGEFTGEAGLVRADGTTVTVQYAGHAEVATGLRRVLFVVLSTSRWGRHSAAEPTTAPSARCRRASARSSGSSRSGVGAGDRRRAADLPRHRPHPRAQRDGEDRRPLARAPGREGARRRPRAR